MRWWKRKKEDDFEIIRKDIPITDIARWFIYDTGIGDPTALANALGMNPDSLEGQEKQEEDSDNRTAQIAYLLPFLDLMSDIVADAITGIQLAEIKEKEPDNVEEIERESNLMHTMYKMISMTTLVGGFSAAMEIGLINSGEITFADTDDMKEDDDE